ncbi:LOW QUALITY PROTEIN: WD repeat- and FYVE domain-containing protein 4 [Dromiciops gliroides]|uniref:LOW QUALITY PROTEIN: WD repeat- and FYVE domain-containing protein 4 n=1 Tax=Dromiciops gliroides TaxID=33562 RepID=UPI001CC3ADBD|nr:LOW QUALITY PROTEIN: WD repeat- and FYVE domain-containing protein 4 [Dromiciops gliroides]
MDKEDFSKEQEDVPNQTDEEASPGDLLRPELLQAGHPQCPTVLWEMLERQFLEYAQAAPFLNPENQQGTLLRLLPLFLKAWEKSAGIICFPSIQEFAEEVSKHLVQEIQKALEGKPAEEARLAIGNLLQWKGEEENEGYLLLKSGYLLTQADSETLSKVIESGLPGLLLQCLYIFFAFPSDKDEVFEGNSQVQKMFVQMMLSIYDDPQGVEELLLGNELQSLLIATSSLWEQSSPSWKAPTFSVLRAISKAQSPSTISYLQTSNSVKIALQNLSRLVDTLHPQEVSEVASLILYFVKDSYSISSTLLLEFENSDGYPILLKILLRYGDNPEDEAEPHLEEILELLVWLTVCGKTELKVFDSVTYPQLEGFQFQHEPSEMTVKNLQAFQVLQNAFQKTNDPLLCRKILSSIKTIWTWNGRNFFLLEWTLQPISQFVEVIHLKHSLVHMQFFQLLEFVVFDLSYIPHEILKKVQNLIKENLAQSCTLVALRSLNRIIAHDLLFTDIFRDSGFLGLLLAQLRKQAKIMRKTGNRGSSSFEDMDRDLACVMLKIVASLLQGSVRNTVVLKDHGMVPFIKIFLDDECFRNDSLNILEQLSTINTEEYMSIIIGALCSSTQGELHLKLDLLKSLLKILENPKGRSAFRTSSGFNGLLSLLSDMEGSLQDPPLETWAPITPSQTMELVLYTLLAMTAALHLDSVNGDFFRRNNLFEKLAEDLCSLGCFGTQEQGEASPHPFITEKTRTFTELLNAAFSPSEAFPSALRSCLQILSFLDSMARGTLHLGNGLKEWKRAAEEVALDLQKNMPIPPDGYSRIDKGSLRPLVMKVWPDLDDRTDDADAVIMHPGVICIMLRLLPSLYHEDHPQLSKEIQCSLANHIQSLVKSEKNRQIMCEAGLLKTILTSCHKALSDSSDPVHLSLIRIFEKLASQAIEPDILRQFLALGIPSAKEAACKTLNTYLSQDKSYHLDKNTGSEAPESSGTDDSAEAIPDASLTVRTVPASKSPWLSKSSVNTLQTAMSLISMTSPRNIQPQKATLVPSFVEFDMSMEGYGYLFIPTLSTIMGANTEHSISGGIGIGPRLFPPPNGLTFSSWFLISKHSSDQNNHPIHFLTLVRHMARTEHQFVCFSASFSPEDLTLTVSTEEKEFEPLDVMEPEDIHEPSAGSRLQFRCGNLLSSGQWHHLAIVVTKEMKRNCTVSTYIDGQLIGSAKMLYIQALPGSFLSMDPSSFVDVYGYIGTPQVWKQKSSLIWRLGPTYLLEEAISKETLEVINKLGPRYCGNFQAVMVQGEDVDREAMTLVAEERVSFGLNVASSNLTNVAEIKNVYNEVDSRLIAKEMNISSRDNSMPVFLVRNSAGHLSGSLRTIGAVAVGHLGVRVFHSIPAANSLNFIGGPAILLGMISLATDDHTMYAAIKVLHSVLSSSAMCDNLMKHIHGYQILTLLLKKKMQLLNNRIFQLILSVAGTVELGFGSSTITNLGIFQHVLCNFELWMNTAENLDIALFSHLIEIFRSPREGPRNAEMAHRVQLIPRLVFLFNDPILSQTKISTITSILGHLLKRHFNTQDVIRIGLFIVYTLKPSSVNEKQIRMDQSLDSMEAGSQTSGRMIWLRNQLLEMLLDVICSNKFHLSSESQEEMFLKLGPDWFLLFIQDYLHPSTVVLGIKLLLHFLYNPTLRTRFKDGLSGGSWVENSILGVHILMDNLKNQSAKPDYGSCLISGFQILPTFLSHHVQIPEVYLLVSSFFLQTPMSEVTAEPKTSLDAMLQWLLQNHNGESTLKSGLCTEGAKLLLEMVKAIIKLPITGSEEENWKVTYPGNVMQFLCLIYHNYPQDPVWRSSDFLQALASILFPPKIPKRMSDSSWNNNILLTTAEGQNSVETPTHSFTTHPARKQVSDFLKLLLREILLCTPTQKQLHPLDFLLEASPENTTNQQKRCFQSEILLSAMGVFHIISEGCCALSSNGTREPQQSSESTPSLANISYLTQKLVEKLYSGMFTADPKEILLFITEQIMGVIENAFSQKEALLAVLYSSLNRVILFCLSKPQQSLSECLGLLSILNFLQEQWDIIFATYNSNMSFIICFMHCLFHIHARSYPEGFGLEPKPRVSPYHQVFLSSPEDMREPGEEGLPSLSDVQHGVLKTVLGLWHQLMNQRRQALEDAFKMDLSVKPGESEVKIENITPLWEETTLKSWQHYLASEKKMLASKSNTVHQSKGSSWSGSLSSAMRLIPGRQTKEIECKTEDFVSCMEEYRRRGQELYASLYKDHVQRQKCVYSKAASEWNKMKDQLFNELGLWGQKLETVPCSQWSLDWREGPARMRKRIRRKFAGESLKIVNQAKNNETSPTNAENQDELMPNGEERDEIEDCTQLTFFPALYESLHSEDFLELCRERKVILQELADKEKVSVKHSVVIVQGHVVSEGVLLFGQQHFYICENFTLSPLGDVYCTKHCLSNISDAFIFNMCSKDRPSDRYTCNRYSYSDIKEIHFMRFLLQETALEIFFRNGYSKFLVFHNSDRSKAFKSFCSLQPGLKGKNITEESLNIRKSIGSEKTMLQKWQKREISNFEYLMYLNTLAGRTYNDLYAVPVFPWILADYTSETLNFTNPKTFRDLSKPMGAQTKERKLKFIQRYKEVEKSEGDLSARCHYCTHYSSAIIIASYLVRMKPFTQTFCSLQGGSFDVADRMFHSVKNAWESASSENMSDVRELIPEFFYLPEFLTNCNDVEFGCMQDGTILDDVLLPPWAEGDPQKFINLHRQALESDFVSANLHHWIDLIFGYKQHGPAAVEAINTFHPYFYGDKMDLQNITDPLIKSTILGFVSNFGQIPKQLFTKPHPARTAQGKPSGKEVSLSTGPTGSPPPFFCTLQNLKPSLVTVKESPKGAIGHIVPTEKCVLAVEKNKVLIPHLWNKTFSWGFDDFTCCLGNYGSDKNLTTFEAQPTGGKCLCAVCPSPNLVITSGDSAVVCIWELSMVKDKAKGLHLKQALYGHTKSVTCLAASMTYSLLVSGSCDQTCILWDLDHLMYVTQLPTHRASISAIAISDSTGDIVSCAGTYLYLWNINGQPLASINTACGSQGDIQCCYLTEGMDWDASNIIITGSRDGIVRIWKTEHVKTSGHGAEPESQTMESPGQKGNKWEKNLALCRELDINVALTGKSSKNSPAITALALSRNQSKLLVGDERGRIYCWSRDG